ncbi:MAG: DUF4340 domain-containing protein [Planctomycetes bacterium]|nr:DUF4340 domain-containing protein [Planctomycetota bacterium]
MKQRTLGILFAAAVAASTAAYVATRTEPAATAEAKSGEKLVPGLVERINDVAKVEVKNKDGGFAVVKDGDTWGMADKGSYPVNFDKVKELVVTIAQMAIVEKKSAKPENHASMDLAEVDAKDAAATQVKLFDKSGAELAAVLIGKARTTKGFGGQYAMYVRKVGDNQAWEVTGRIWIDGSSTNWLADNRQITKLEKTRVRRVETRHTDGTTLAVFKNVPEDQAFTVGELPEGAELKWNGVADATAAALEYLTFEDVAQAGAVDLASLTPTETTFTTWDGLVLTAKLYERGEGEAAKAYLTLSAAFDESLRFKKEAPVGPPPPEGADPAAATDPAATPETPKPADEFVGKAPEDVKKEVEELNAKLSKWTYTIPGYTAANFKKTVKDMLKEPAAPGEGEPPLDGSAPIESPPTDAGGTPVQDGGAPAQDGGEHDGHDHGSHDHGATPTPPSDSGAPGEPEKQDSDGGR